MTPMDADLRSVLHQHADQVAPPADLFAAAQRRAGHIRRRRYAAASGAAAVVLGAVAIAVPLSLADHDRSSVTPVTPATTRAAAPTPSTSPPSSPPASPAASTAARPAAWAFRGDRAIATRERSALPPGGMVTALFASADQNGFALFFVQPAGTAAHFALTHAGTAVGSEPASGDRPFYGLLHGEAQGIFLVVADPQASRATRTDRCGTSTLSAVGGSPGVYEPSSLACAADPTAAISSVTVEQPAAAGGLSAYTVSLSAYQDDAAPATGGQAADVRTWTFRGDRALRDRLLPAATKAVIGNGWTVDASIWAGTTPTGGWSALILRGHDGQSRDRLFTWLARGDGGLSQLVRSDVIEPSTIEVDQQLPGDPSDFLVILGPPTTGQIEYSADGTAPKAVQTTDGTALIGRSARGGSSVELVQLLDGDGKFLYNADLSAGGFVAIGQARATVPNLVADEFYQAWRRGDRATARTYGSAAAVQHAFALASSLHYVGGQCVPGKNPPLCLYNGRNFANQPALMLTLSGDGTHGYQVTKVARGTE